MEQNHFTKPISLVEVPQRRYVKFLKSYPKNLTSKTQITHHTVNMYFTYHDQVIASNSICYRTGNGVPSEDILKTAFFIRSDFVENY